MALSPDPRFVGFYAATAERMLNLARRLVAGDVHLARDVTQEAYARMLERWDQRRWFDVEDNRRYTVGVVVNLVTDSYRQRGRVTELVDEHVCGEDDHALDAVLDEMSTLQAIRTFIDRQPVRRRAVATLYFIEGFGYSEIAEALGMSTSTARTHVERLRVLLKPIVDRITDTGRRGEQL